MFCSNCGTENPKTASFCSKCGSPMNKSESPIKKKNNKSIWIIISFIVILLLICVSVLGYGYSRINSIPTSTPWPTPTTQPELSMSIYDIAFVDKYKITYRGGFITKLVDLEGIDSVNRPNIKEGEYLITVAFEIENISNVVPNSGLISPKLISPNNNVYDGGYDFFYTFCEINNPELGFENDYGVYMDELLPGVTKKVVQGYVISQKEFDESENDWLFELQLETVRVKIPIPKNSLYEQLSNKFVFYAGIKDFEGKINQNSIIGTPQP